MCMNTSIQIDDDPLSPEPSRFPEELLTVQILRNRKIELWLFNMSYFARAEENEDSMSLFIAFIEQAILLYSSGTPICTPSKTVGNLHGICDGKVFRIFSF